MNSEANCDERNPHYGTTLVLSVYRSVYRRTSDYLNTLGQSTECPQGYSTIRQLYKRNFEGMVEFCGEYLSSLGFFYLMGSENCEIDFLIVLTQC